MASPEQVLELARGLEALPPGLRRVPGQVLELESHPEPSDWGLGDDSPEHPEWTQGLRRFHLYAYRDGADERAGYRLAQLSQEERRALWLRRAVVHAVLRRWDALRGWSGSPRFRDIVGWPLAEVERRSPGLSPLNTFAWAFSRQRGMASPVLDLLTFAEEALVPVESLRPEALAVDDTVRCQERTKLRFLHSALSGAPPPAGPCPLLDAWTSPSTLSHLEVLFAEPTAENPESAFGHLLVRIVRTDDAQQGDGTRQLLEVAALVGFRESPLSFAVQGLTGGYSAIFSLSTVAAIRRSYLETDQRTVRRYRLNLEPDEAARALERFWELQRRGYLGYRFLDRNCGSLLAFMLNPVMGKGRRVSLPKTPWVAPAAVLDVLARIPAGPGHPHRAVLQRALPDLESSRVRALSAERDGQRLLDRLRDTVPGASSAWRAWWDEASCVDPERRTRAHQAWAEERDRTLETLLPAARPAVERLLNGLLEAQRPQERYRADRGRRAAEAIELARVETAGLVLPSPRQMLEKRQLENRKETGPQLEPDLLQRLRFESLLAKAPRRPATAAETAVLSQAEKAQRAFLGLMRLQATLPHPERAVAAPPEAEPSTGLVSSGLSRLSLGTGLQASSDRPGAVLGLWVRAALLSEQMGEDRAHGAGVLSGLQLADVALLFLYARQQLTLSSVEAELFRLRTLAREPGAGFLGKLGRGAGLSYRYQQGPGPHRVEAFAEAVPVLFSRPRASAFWLAPLALVAQARFQEGWAAGPRLSLEARLPLGERRWLTGSLWASQKALAAPAGLRFEQEFQAKASAHQLLGRFALAASLVAQAQLGNGNARWLGRALGSVDWP